VPRTRYRPKRTERLNRPPLGEPWVWFTRAMLESPAYLVLSINARRILDRLCCEHMNHGGAENGRLKCTYTDFTAFGASRELIPAALRELECLGWVRYVRGGRWGGVKAPSVYTLTWLPVDGVPATNDWKRHTDDTVQTAMSELRADRRARDLHRKGKGPQKQLSGTASRTGPVQLPALDHAARTAQAPPTNASEQEKPTP
jgi:hypothetical protein